MNGTSTTQQLQLNVEVYYVVNQLVQLVRCCAVGNTEGGGEPTPDMYRDYLMFKL
jgi:hypothetical protein